MKKFILLLIIYTGILSNNYAQTYLQGIEVLPLSDAAHCDLLTPSNRITADDAFLKLKQLIPDPVEENISDMVGEFWWIDGMLVNTVTRRITAQRLKINLYDRQKAKAPEIIYVTGTTPDRTLANDYFSEIKSMNNFEVLVDYFKTRSNYKRFLVQDNKGKFIVMGTIYVKKQDAQKAHELIDLILNSLYFKQ
ncbi:MAG: hypothetical protein LBV59_19710 [Sphingobacterium sp.]|jgi:hypothetical protein|uniref:hypothetical protein n=1 Tax=Sphingobacterium sp. TaxID=341027 RepID=UPI002829F39E|nr:hypothetical protein [Sphingobacterium sp.]MDR0266255.1 hypothetical protein [Sphingobacterium sp.]MDR3010170.1 hypothetical protein [Sphingobacterium sp.]